VTRPKRADIPCAACGECPVLVTKPGDRRFQQWDDACIADLPGVAFACCGHGGLPREIDRGEAISHPYLVLGDRWGCVVADDYNTARGDYALRVMRLLGGRPA
jgi:hypothetical protein